MEYTKEYLRELAESIYDLDAEVYAQLGSSLGRVFNRDREGCVNDIIRLMLGNDSHQLRSELALISNDRGKRGQIYDHDRIQSYFNGSDRSSGQLRQQRCTG